MRYDTNGSGGKGYIITVCNSENGPFICNALHVEMDTQNWPYNDDDEAARAAQRDGVKLVYGIPFVEDGVYLDTPENRNLLKAYSRRMSAAVRKKNRES